jgi:hypothetical protein
MLSLTASGRSQALAVTALAALGAWTLVAHGDPPALAGYPTYARVEYVQDCMGRNRGGLADLYKCSCAIDHIAAHLSYDDYVEASTFAHYSTLPGEGGGIFRDPQHAKEQASLYRKLEGDAYHACGLKTAANARP